MKALQVKKTLCITLTAIAALSSVACGSNAAAQGNVTTQASAVAGEEPGASGNTEPGTAEPTTVITPTATIAARPETRAFEGKITDRFPDADHIDQISAGRYIVVKNDHNKAFSEVTIFDAYEDAVVNVVQVPNLGEWFLEPTVFTDRGFGFTIESTTNFGKDHAYYAYYYDLDGNLVNDFCMPIDANRYGNCALAPDGSALYAITNNMDMCSCGYIFNTDYTNRVQVMYGDGTEEVIEEFDSHYALNLLGVTKDGRLLLDYRYDPNDLEARTHEEWEMMNIRVGGSADAGIERGFAVMNVENGSDHTPELFYEMDGYYRDLYVKGDVITLIDDGDVVRLSPDENGNYQNYQYTESGERANDWFVSTNGDYIVLDQVVDQIGTRITVLHFDGDAFVCEMEDGCDEYVRFGAFGQVSFLDEETGDLYGVQVEEAEIASGNEGYHMNIF